MSWKNRVPGPVTKPANVRRCFSCGGKAVPTTYQNAKTAKKIFVCRGCSKLFEVRA